MAVLSNRDLENATQQIVKEDSFKKEVKQVIQKEMINKFDQPVLVEEIKSA